MRAFWWAVAAAGVYGYVIVLSLWATRVQRRAAEVYHHPHDHAPEKHTRELTLHQTVAVMLMLSLALRLAQLRDALPGWLVIPLTFIAALFTLYVAGVVRRMAMEDVRNWYVGGIGRAKAVVLAGCATLILLDQIWRIVQLFWFR